METWGKKWVKQHPIFVRIKETELKKAKRKQYNF